MVLKYARLDTSCLIMDFIWITHLCLENVLYKHYVPVWNIYVLFELHILLEYIVLTQYLR